MLRRRRNHDLPFSFVHETRSRIGRSTTMRHEQVKATAFNKDQGPEAYTADLTVTPNRSPCDASEDEPIRKKATQTKSRQAHPDGPQT